jgi:hypothetical protein
MSEVKHPMVNVQIVKDGASYTDLKRSYKSGEVYALKREEWDIPPFGLKYQMHPITNKPIFREVVKKATAHAESTERPDRVEGKITITHNVPNEGTDKPGPNDLASADLKAAGLSDEVDTGEGVTIEEEAGPETPVDLSDLDDPDNEGVTLRDAVPPAEITIEHAIPDADKVVVSATPAPEVQEPTAKAPTAPPKPPTAKKVVVARPGPRNAALKDKLPAPAPKSPDDEVQV